MHIAICDDNVVDRKHLERILSRESDKRAGTPNILYVDSYGDKDYFLKNPLKYNLIFMDMCSSPGIVEEILSKLDDMYYNAPLILYSSQLDYTSIPNLPSYVVHAQKPYTPDSISDYLKLGDSNVANNTKTISVHENDITLNLPISNILYMISINNQSYIHTTDNFAICVHESLNELTLLLEPYEEFSLINKKTIVNFRHVLELTPINIVMQNHTKFSASLLNYKNLKYLKEKYTVYNHLT